MGRQLLFLLVVFLTNVIQCVTGFAGTVLAMPFSVLLVGYDTAKPVLNVLGLLASVYVVCFCLRQIDRRELLKMTGVMLLGLVAGMALKPYVAGDPTLLYGLLGAIVIAFAVMNAAKLLMHKEDVRLPAPVSALLLVSAGVVHGLFVCGGPLLVTYASGRLQSKDAFRGTLSAVWILLNGILFGADLAAGSFTPDVVRLTAFSAAALAAALVVGSFVAKKLSRKAFLYLTYILMLISGVSLFLK
ncbi:MAG: sulfite exporter TauE/SafE family protein [Clostridia bacterium]|nr:sulfite exporter TauE/SafE family protein [Clostridia bacterium]